MPVDYVYMTGGAVGMAVDQPRIAVVAQRRLDFGRRNIHDLGRLAAFFLLALPAQGFDLRLAFGQGFFEKIAYPGVAARLAPERLVFPVERAQRVAVHEQDRLSIQAQQSRIVQQ